MGSPELQGGPRGESVSLHFLGNLNRQALNLRQEAESGYQELGAGGGGGDIQGSG